MKSEVESSFVAGRSGEVCENSPVSCPPTPSNYTPISEHPVLDSVSSHVKELDNPSQNKTLANEQWSYINNTQNSTPSSLPKTQNSTQEAKQVMNLDTCKDRTLRGLNRRLPSPPRNESLTTLHQQSSEVFNELLEKKRQDLQNTNSSSRQDSQIFSSYSCQASSSIEAPLPVQDSPTGLWREAKTPMGGSKLVFIKPDSPHPRPRSVDSQIHPMTVLDESPPSQVDRLRTEAGMLCSWDDDDRECSSRVSNDVLSILLDRKSGLFQNSNTHRTDSGSLSPRLKLNLKSLQICPPKNHLLLSFRETQVSLEEGIINTESEIFFDNDKTSNKVLLKEKGVFQTMQNSKQRAPELHRCLLPPPPPPPQGEGFRPAAASSRRGSIIKAMLHREKTLFPFCGCLGSFHNNTQNRN